MVADDDLDKEEEDVQESQPGTQTQTMNVG